MSNECRGRDCLTGRNKINYMADGAIPPVFVERRKKWSFFMLGDGSWVWRVLHPDGTEASSPVSFPTVDECTADAALRGYVSRGPEQERRRQSDPS